MKLRANVLATAMLAMAPALAWAQAPGSGIAGTAHDFYGGTFTPVNTNIGMCTFCHTPHKAIQTSLLWNHKLSSATFSWDITSTIAGTVFPSIVGNTYTGPTAKCLSCHDGTVAIGDVNWFNEQAWPGGTGLDTRTITDTTHQVGAGGAMAGNHPVAMPYPLSNARNTYNGKQNGVDLATAEWVADPRTKNIRLYDDSSGKVLAYTGAGVITTAGIECSSCHDPHNKAATGDMYLRGTLTGNTDAYICLKCHVK